MSISYEMAASISCALVNFCSSDLIAKGPALDVWSAISFHFCLAYNELRRIYRANVVVMTPSWDAINS